MSGIFRQMASFHVQFVVIGLDGCSGSRSRGSSMRRRRRAGDHSARQGQTLHSVPTASPAGPSTWTVWRGSSAHSGVPPGAYRALAGVRRRAKGRVFSAHESAEFVPQKLAKIPAAGVKG